MRDPKELKSKLSILDEIMGLCDKSASSPFKKKEASVMAIIEPKEEKDEEAMEDPKEEAMESPKEEAMEDSMEPKEPESSDAAQVKAKLADMDVEELMKLYEKLK